MMYNITNLVFHHLKGECKRILIAIK